VEGAVVLVVLVLMPLMVLVDQVVLAFNFLQHLEIQYQHQVQLVVVWVHQDHLVLIGLLAVVPAEYNLEEPLELVEQVVVDHPMDLMVLIPELFKILVLAAEQRIVMEVLQFLMVATVVPVLSSSLILHK
jgi:hypothetical protein